MIRSICDLCDDHPDLVQVAEPVFTEYGGVRSFHGPITTLRCHEDNLLLKTTLATPGRGRVMVVDGGGSLRKALFGDVLAGLAVQHGWAGIIINGAVRDVENTRDMPVGVRALAACPRRPLQSGAGERDVAVSFAGVDFAPGMYAYADLNGLIVSTRALG
jgi:regulator of ribonuclease activity A